MKFKLFLFSFIVSLTVQAQQMRDVFANMPDSVLQIMTKNNRLDCIDFIENKMEAKVRNRFDGYSVLKRLTNDYLELSLTQRTQIEMKLLPLTDSLHVVAVLKTYSGPVSESVLRCYNTKWEVLPLAHLITYPVDDDYWIKDDSVSIDDLNRLKSLLDMRMVKMHFQEGMYRLVFELQPGEVDKEVADEMKLYMRPVVYEWKDGRFIKQGDIN